MSTVAVTDSAAAPTAADKLRRQVLNPWALRAFMLAKLPMGLLAGLRVTELDERAYTATVPYWWLTTNPFRSTYFAVLAMAAELSTGVLGLVAVRGSGVPVSTLVVGMNGSFEKKATRVTSFRCTAGKELAEAVQETLRTGEGVTRQVETIGTGPDGQVVARFTFTWSFRRKPQT